MKPEGPTNEQHLLQKATEKFTNTTGVTMNVTVEEHPNDNDRRFDALLQVAGVTATNTYAVEIKRHLTIAKLGLVAEHLKDAPYKGMLVTDYVNPNMAERLKEMGLAFIDLAGNAYLDEPPIFVYVRGNRPLDDRQLGATQKPTRAFQPTGLKMLFGLLTNPGLLQQPYRDIAGATHVALGTTGLVLTDLREHGLLLEVEGRGRRLTQKRQLIEQWVAAYPDKLRPKLRLGRYTAAKHRWWENVNLQPHNAQWGGEVAAARMTNYLKPEKVVIYADAIPARLIVENQLKTDPEGDVEILHRFWNPRHLEQTKTQIDLPEELAPPLLVYADLMATADGRNIETAKMIYEEFLHGYFE